jgi:hypothetical protein
VVVILIDGERWVEVDTLADSGPGDSHFVVDRSGGSAQVRFGDGRQGRVPPAGATFDVTTYAGGAGAAGNVLELPILEGGTVVIRIQAAYDDESGSDLEAAV